MFLLVPWGRGGVAAEIQWPLQICALLFSLWPAFWRTTRYDAFCLGVISVPLIQLIPLPSTLWQQLPGRELYHQALSLLDLSAPAWPSWSLLPYLTESALLTLLAPLWILRSACLLDSSRLLALARWLLFIALAQALLGLMQYGVPPEHFLHLSNPFAAYQQATGTYANRNHLAGLLEMCLPIALGLWAVHVGQHQHHSRHRKDWRTRLAQLGSTQAHRSALYALLTLGLLLGLIFTRSRSGILLSMLGILLSLLVFTPRLGGRNTYGMIGTLSSIALGLAALIGLLPVLARFALQDPLTDARWEIFRTTWEGIKTFFPLGSGMGTYPAVYHRFQSENLTKFINHAHNDYLEWLFEGGLLIALLLIWGLWIYLRQWPRIWRTNNWSEFTVLQIGAGLGLFSMALHSLVEFQLHTPANALYFAFLAGVFLHSPEAESSSVRRRLPKRVADEPPPTATSNPDISDVRNPFLD